MWPSLVNCQDDFLINRFWSKVDCDFNNPDKCWNWKAAIRTDGYGQFWYKKHMVGSNIMAYTFSKGEIPNKLLVCHTCDNPPCCNPNHLFLGTVFDNSRDMVNKNRDVTGIKTAKFKTASRYVGVKRTLYETWEAGIKISQKQKYLGSFKNEDDAAHAYDVAYCQKRKVNFGVNFPEIQRFFE
jgi:glycosylphosphatidylinositol transamidase (GPIT) subunit GPI8